MSPQFYNTFTRTSWPIQWHCDLTRGRPYAFQTPLVGWTGDITEWNSDLFFPLSFFAVFFRLFVFLSPFNFTLLSCLLSLLHSSLLPSYLILPLLLLFLRFPLLSVPTGRRYWPMLLSVCLCVLIFTGRRLLSRSVGSSRADIMQPACASSCCNQKSVTQHQPWVSSPWARPQCALSLRSDMAQFAALCLLLPVVRVLSQGEFFRTELFPEQLQQQQVQLVQRQIQDHLQLLQAQAQAASSVEQQVSVSVCHGSYRVGYLSVQGHAVA